eukprot:491628-Karenia_brevis.AAC.1
MSGYKWDPNILSYALWAGVFRGRAKRIIASTGGDCYDIGLSKYFRYLGHVARGSSGKACQTLLKCRNTSVVKDLSHKHDRHKDFKCRRGGTQLP